MVGDVLRTLMARRGPNCRWHHPQQGSARIDRTTPLFRVIPKASGYFMLKSSMAVLPRIFCAVSTDVASKTAWMASQV